MKVKHIAPATLVIKYETEFEKDFLARFVHEHGDQATVIVMGQDGEAAKEAGTYGDPHFYQKKPQE